MQNILSSPLFPMIMMFVVLYFFFLRPKQKEMAKAETMRKELKKGDKVSTSAGILGIVHSVGDRTVIIKADENVKLEFEKHAITRVIHEAEEVK